MENINTKISVLMPVYNQSGFIRRAWKSLEQQTYKNWELIIINDGSTDNVENVLQDINQDSRVNYIKNERNQGLGFSLNKGLKYATGEYIAYLPADDIYYKNHWKLFVKFWIVRKIQFLHFPGLYLIRVILLTIRLKQIHLW
ncbi:MAG: glycosyltransferase family 2 protein [Tannerellaceae bacterium]|nr:glycosyltransferase family 2 protein [Tannerellaceae bacterium]